VVRPKRKAKATIGSVDFLFGLTQKHTIRQRNTIKVMNTNQKIASVLLTSRLRQFLVAVLSVTFGISMYVFMNSFMAGVNNE